MRYPLCSQGTYGSRKLRFQLRQRRNPNPSLYNYLTLQVPTLSRRFFSITICKIDYIFSFYASV
jgi:hypothetical protein